MAAKHSGILKIKHQTKKNKSIGMPTKMCKDKSRSIFQLLTHDTSSKQSYWDRHTPPALPVTDQSRHSVADRCSQ